MQLSNSFIEQIKDRILLSSLISRLVKLEKKGDHFIGLCPFHSEKTPSFTVNDSKGFYYCFGCHANGDAIEFIKNTENLTFHEAMSSLAEKVGLPMPDPPIHKTEQSEKSEVIYSINMHANEWFQRQLLLTSAANAQNYLQDRSIDLDTIKLFNIGFAPTNKDALSKYLKTLNFQQEDIILAGLANTFDNKLVDKFRNRIIFPIINRKGRVIAFGGRSLDENQQPKYLNSPETILFKKSDVLYGENLATDSILKKKRVIVVEGYMDNITLHKNGFSESVATLGTALTQNHLQKLWKLNDEPTICLDGDQAGLNAMDKIATLALPHLVEGKSLKFVILPRDMDPDDVINKLGKNAFIDLITQSKDLSEIIWQKELKKIKNKTPEQISALEKNINLLINNISNATVKKNYGNFFKKQLWSFSKDYNVKKKNNILPKILPSNDLDLLSRYQHMLVAELIANPLLLQDHAIREELLHINFRNQYLNEVCTIICEYVDNCKDNEKITKQDIKNILLSCNLSYIFDFLCGKYSQFIDNMVSEDIYRSKIKWNILKHKYDLMQLEGDFMRALLDENNKERSVFYKNEIYDLKEKINKLESLYINEN